MCAYHCAQLSYTLQHKTILIIFPLTRWTSTQHRCCLLEGRGTVHKYACSSCLTIVLSVRLWVSEWYINDRPPARLPVIAASRVDTWNRRKASSTSASVANDARRIFAKDSAMRTIASSCLHKYTMIQIDKCFTVKLNYTITFLNRVDKQRKCTQNAHKRCTSEL